MNLTGGRFRAGRPAARILALGPWRYVLWGVWEFEEFDKIEVREASFVQPGHRKRVVLAEVLGFTAMKQFDCATDR